jgi:hypothetical protein
MNLQEFALRLDGLNQHVAAIMETFQEDTGVMVSCLEAVRDDDGTIIVRTGLDFPEEESTQ